MTKIILLAYLVLFYGIAFFWRSYQTYRETGVNPYKLNEGNILHRFAGKWYRYISIGVAGIVLVFVFFENWYAYLAPIEWLIVPTISVVGTSFLFISFIWVLIAQTQMGSSWRIGIDEDNPTALITKGVFRISRNPIFLGMRLNLAGLFLILPNALTFGLWLLGDVLLQIQVFLEEEYLLETHGEPYQKYCQQVRRWF